MKSFYARTRYVRTLRLRRLRNRQWYERVVDYLANAESRAQTIDEGDDYAFCRRLVSCAFEDWIDPWVTAFYYTYGAHPSKVIPSWLEQQQKHERMEIPDYDPTIETRGSHLTPLYRFGEAFLGPTLAEQLQDPTFLKSLSPAKPFFSRLQTRLKLGPEAGFIMCTECQEPVCEGKTRCELHLRLSNEAVKRSSARKRLEHPTLCLNCGNPASEGKRRCELHLRLAREDSRRLWMRKKANEQKATPVRRPPSSGRSMPQMPASGGAA
jgi:hypothetical protein